MQKDYILRICSKMGFGGRYWLIVSMFRTLQYVNLSNNQLTGPLAPARFASIFAEKLRVLDMNHNQLSGNLPDFEFEIGPVTLRLNHNLFAGAVPSTLLSTNVGLLGELYLSNNNLSGEITRELPTIRFRE